MEEKLQFGYHVEIPDAINAVKIIISGKSEMICGYAMTVKIPKAIKKILVSVLNG